MHRLSQNGARIRSEICLNQDFLFDKFPLSRYNSLSLFFGLGLWYISSNNQNIEIGQCTLCVGTENARKRNKVGNEIFAVLHLSMFFYFPNRL